MYEEDKKLYGSPKTTTFSVTDIMKIPHSQVVLNSQGGNVIALESLKIKQL